ncbi:MAG: carbohydrate-binding family 9-like protein [Candidatus Omnitrophica bacterium]|nr:carbohydrate-binding family 9-like protein [Candidatus Omnitrophota bacterium]
MKRIILFLFVSFSIYLFAERQIYVAERATGKIIIDGNITEEEWGKTPTIKRFYRAGDINKKVNSETIVWIKYDDNYLYIAGRMEDKDIVAKATGIDGSCWNDDVFEIFIKPKFKSPHYYEIEINPIGTVFDAFYPRTRIHFLRSCEYKSQLNFATKIKGTLNNWKDIDEGWDIEIAIPFSDFSETTTPPKKGDVWYFAICRYDYSYYLPYIGVELTSSAKLRRANFHLFYDYDKLLFK